MENAFELVFFFFQRTNKVIYLFYERDFRLFVGVLIVLMLHILCALLIN